MRLASIDIGSNTIRLLVATVEDGRVIPLRHEREVTRLATGIHSGGVISEGPLGKTLESVRRFAMQAQQDGVRKIRAVATSAIREAQNGKEVARMLSSSAGLDVEVISGDEEARITALGVMQGLGTIEDAIIFDLGGGSTEFICITGGKVVKAETIPVGVVKLHEKCLFSDPPAHSELAALDRLVAEAADKVRRDFKPLAIKGLPLIGTAGTATTLASMDLQLKAYDWKLIQGHEILRHRLVELEGLMLSVPLDKRRLLQGMDPSRADLIIAGTRLTIKVMEALGYDSITVSDHGLLEGLIVALYMED